MNKDLIRGFLLAHNAPKEIMDALEIATTQPTIVVRLPELPTLDQLYDDMLSENNGGRAVNCLRNEGIKTTEELLTLESGYLLRVPNFGRKSLNTIKNVLKKHNLKLAA